VSAHFLEHSILKVLLRCNACLHLLPFHACIIFQCMDGSHCVYTSSSALSLGLLPPFGCCEHECASICFQIHLFPKRGQTRVTRVPQSCPVCCRGKVRAWGGSRRRALLCFPAASAGLPRGLPRCKARSTRARSR
jgi:hypothetical protein